MKKIIIVLLLLTSMIQAKEYKVVFNLTSGSEEKIAKSLIKNVEVLRANYKKQGDTLKVAVVISGHSYKFFLKESSYPDLDLKKFSKNVNFEVCSVGMKKRNIKKTSLLPFVVPAFNRTEALIRYQNNGYAYVPIN